MTRSAHNGCGRTCGVCRPHKKWPSKAEPLARDARKLQPEGDDREPEPQASCGDPDCGDKCSECDDPWFDGVSERVNAEAPFCRACKGPCEFAFRVNEWQERERDRAKATIAEAFNGRDLEAEWRAYLDRILPTYGEAIVRRIDGIRFSVMGAYPSLGWPQVGFDEREVCCMSWDHKEHYMDVEFAHPGPNEWFYRNRFADRCSDDLAEIHEWLKR